MYLHFSARESSWLERKALILFISWDSETVGALYIAAKENSIPDRPEGF